MIVLCILLAMLSLFLLLKLIYQRKLVRKIKKQIDFLTDRDTQTEIMVEKTDRPIQDLATSINHLLKKYRSMGQEIERSDTLFRDTITSLSHDLRTPLATANGYIQLLQEQDLTGDQKEYVMEIICCLDEQLELSRQENSNLILKYLGKHDDFYLDVLTGAYNRRFYEEKIKHQTTPAGIVMLDVDDFKIYNDTFGHDFGDRVLKMIVEHIKNSLRNQDKLIRYGGDEFIIYLPNIEIEDFYLIMQNILENIHHATIRRYESVQFSLSAGITMYQTGTIEEAVSLADHLLYHAKRKKNCIFTELDHQYYSDRNDTKQTILIVDDSELNRAILYEILKDDFYLLEATNGQKCIDYIKQYGSGISLILLDIIMPEIDGFDVLQWMEQEKWLDDIPVILISSEDSANIINKGFAMGASDYIKRPFDYRIVYRRVYNIIKLYAKQKRLMDLLKKQVEKN